MRLMFLESVQSPGLHLLLKMLTAFSDECLSGLEDELRFTETGSKEKKQVWVLFSSQKSTNFSLAKKAKYQSLGSWVGTCQGPA